MKTFELSKDLIDNISDLILNKNNKEIKKIVRVMPIIRVIIKPKAIIFFPFELELVQKYEIP